MTDFQKTIYDYLKSSITGRSSVWLIAQYAFPEKWERLQGRGALIGHINRAVLKMSDKMYSIPGENRHSCPTICLKNHFTSVVPLNPIFGVNHVL